MQLTLRTKALLAVAAAVTVFVVFGPSGTETVAPAADHSASNPAARRAALDNRQPFDGAFARLAHRVADAASASTLFEAHSWYIPPPPPPPVVRPVIEAPVVPTAPPLPFAYMGSYLADGGAAVYYVTRNDRIYDLKVGDTLDGTYSFDGLKDHQLVFTYKPLNVQQTLATELHE